VAGHRLDGDAFVGRRVDEHGGDEVGRAEFGLADQRTHAVAAEPARSVGRVHTARLVGHAQNPVVRRSETDLFLRVGVGSVLSPLQIAQLPESLRSLLATDYGLLVLLGVFVLEGAMLLYIVPSELVVPGALALLGGSVRNAVLIVAVAVVGATIGQFLLFTVAKRLGRERLLQSRWFRVSDHALARFEGWFDRWGPVVVPVSNTLLFTRGMVTVPAGLAGMDDRRFLLLSALGTLSFEAILAGLYLWFGTVL
jgi:membrane protein DedA with SNARE-associated domain